MKILCKKDWYLDGKLGYKTNKYYQVLRKEQRRIGNCVIIKAPDNIKTYGNSVIFWSGSDYFDVDELFERS